MTTSSTIRSLSNASLRAYAKLDADLRDLSSRARIDAIEARAELDKRDHAATIEGSSDV